MLPFGKKQKFDRNMLTAGAGLTEERKLTLLRRQTAKVDELDEEVDEEEDFWANIDLKKMSRLDLKVALQARSLSTKGSKRLGSDSINP